MSSSTPVRDVLHQLDRKGLEMQARKPQAPDPRRHEEYRSAASAVRRRLRDRPRTDPVHGRNDVRSGQRQPRHLPFRGTDRHGVDPRACDRAARSWLEQANDELAGETDPEAQHERGQFLGRLLDPPGPAVRN